MANGTPAPGYVECCFLRLRAALETPPPRWMSVAWAERVGVGFGPLVQQR